MKVVQARLRHASAKTTLDTYAHLWPDADESTRAAIDVVMAARADCLALRKGWSLDPQVSYSPPAGLV